MVALAGSHLLESALYACNMVTGIIYIDECLQFNAFLGKIALRQVGGVIKGIVDGLQNICVYGRMTGVGKD